MGFVALSDSSDNSFDDLPWLNEYVLDQGKKCEGTVHFCQAIKPTTKGFICFFDSFQFWVWRKSTQGSTLTTALNDAKGMSTYPILAVQIKSKIKEKGLMGFMDDIQATYSQDTELVYHLVEQISLPLEVSPNAKK